MDIIILNGASSSGKSSIAKQLQMLLKDNYLHVGIDTFISMMPERCNELAKADVISDGFYWKTLPTNNQSTLKIQSGAYGRLVNSVYRATVKQFAEAGLKVIVVDVMDGSREQSLWIEELGGVSYGFVGVHCELPILEERERQRKDRIVGSSREQATRVHQGVMYNCEVDSTTYSSKQCAKEIIREMNLEPK